MQDLVYSEDNNDIICVTETWLNSDISNSEILNEGYEIFWKDRFQASFMPSISEIRSHRFDEARAARSPLKFAFRKLARSPTDFLQEKFKYLRAQAKQALKVSRKQYYDCLGKTMYSNPKRFCKQFKLNSRTSIIPQSVLWKTENDQKVANNTISIAELFNGYFASIFTNRLHNHEMKNTNTAHFNEPPPQILNEINFSELEVFAALRSLNPDKALGPDGIPGRILKETAQQIAP